jgi:hypothetical protein
MSTPSRALWESELLLLLRDVVERYESDTDAARALGISRSHLSRVLREEKPMTARLAHALGYDQRVIFVPYEHRSRSGKNVERS